MDESFRDWLQAGDREAVAAIVAGSGFFNPAECAVAVELVDAALEHGAAASGYHFLFAEPPPFRRKGVTGRVIAYACYGPIAGTQASFDLYWIAVADRARGTGVGRRLLERVMDAVRDRGGGRVYAETSSRPQYEPTRRFYEAAGFKREALLPDFYAPGDGKVIYLRLTTR